MERSTSIDESLPLLANGKPHVSYSEVSTWASCAWRHKLIYIDGLKSNDVSPYLDYGTILHDAAEGFLQTRKIDLTVVHSKICEAWKLNGFDTPEFIKAQTARADSQGWKYKHVPLQGWLDSATNALTQLPGWFDEKYPGWKIVAAEHRLYESIDNTVGKFKGFIDCIIELPNGKQIIIDWKTSGPGGWRREKQRDFLTLAQVALYKSFWMQVTGLDSKNIKVAFVLLKRDAKPGKSVSVVEVSAGPVVMTKTMKMVTNMLKGMNRGMALKNKHSCKFCEFSGTEHCT